MRTSKYAGHAREGGYEKELRAYAAAGSWVQAQVIEGRRGVGYDSAVPFRHHGGRQDVEAEQELFDKALTQAAAGNVRVAVPPSLVEVLKEASRRRPRVR